MKLSDLFVIMNGEERDVETNEPLFWSNKEGWVSLESCDVEHNEIGSLPYGEGVSRIRLSYAIGVVADARNLA